MKYALNAKAIEERLSMIESLLGRMPNNLRSLTLEKIKVYLHEYINKEFLMELEKEFVSIGQRLGFESAGDYRRKLEKQVANQAKEISTLANEVASLRARIAELMAK